MYDFAKLDNKDRDLVFNAVAVKKGFSKAIVEKDFWVCLILDYLFTKSIYKDKIVFKGGTSLSKGFNIINRFSEDIDLILDWRVLNAEKDEPLAERSNTQQDIYNEMLKSSAAEFIKTKLLIDIQTNLSKLIGNEIEAEVDKDDKDGTTLNIYYPKIYEIKYIRPHVKLEIGPLAAWSPSDVISILPFVSEEMPKIFNLKSTQVLTVKPERTFWEKATILHREANRKIESTMPLKYSRHYYDLYQFSKTPYCKNALNDKALLELVVRFKQKFYRSSWANYDDCLNGNFKLVPPSYRQSELKKDYLQMNEMIYDVIPTFEEIMCRLAELEKTINKYI